MDNDDTMMRAFKLEKYIEEQSKDFDMFSFCASICTAVDFYCEKHDIGIKEFSDMLQHTLMAEYED